MCGIKVFIFFGCCDKLMGILFCWESCLLRVLKVLLIIEEDDLESGLKVWIVYFNFGKEILCVIKDREKKELFDIVKEYLSCLLLEWLLLGIDCFEEFMINMLICWKSGKVYKFSLFIEEIKGEDLDFNYDKVVEILKFGFKKI